MIRNNKISVVPILIVLLSFVLSPDFYNLFPEKYAHAISALAVVIATFLPQLKLKKYVAEEQQETPPT